jgi:hypothetical protein
METLSPALILVVFVIVLLAILTILEGGRRRMPPPNSPKHREAWEEVARLLGGSIDDASRIRFKWNGCDVSLVDDGSIVFKISGGSFGSLNLEYVASEAISEENLSFLKLEDFRVMKVRGDLETARALLSPRVRRLLRDLVGGAGGRTRVLIHDVFRVEGRPARNPKSLVRFARLCLQLAQHAKLFTQQTTAVQVVETGSSLAGVCQVCGAELGGKLVRCSRCSTPHHADCWEYAGVCSTYGCGGTSVAD